MRHLAGSARVTPMCGGPRCLCRLPSAFCEVVRIMGLPDRLPMRRLPGTDLWYVILEVPEGSRIEYQLEVSRAGRTECHNDPLNPRLSYSPVGNSSVCFGPGYVTPAWTVPDAEAPPGRLDDLTVRSRALGSDYPVTLYLPAGFRPTGAYPL